MTLLEARKTLNPVLRSAGFAPAHTERDYDVAAQNILTARISQTHGSGVVVLCNVHPSTHPARAALLREKHVRALIVKLAEAGFPVNLEAFETEKSHDALVVYV